MSYFSLKKADGARVLYWPIRLGWGPASSSCWFRVHGVEMPAERVPPELTSKGCVPGYRAQYAWVFHLGRLKLQVGFLSERRQQWLRDEARREYDEWERRTRSNALATATELNRLGEQASWRAAQERRKEQPR